jgi:tRNA A-37 threonylcarbamoyl transferase component Bud32
LHAFAERLADSDEAIRRRKARRCAAVLGSLLGRMHGWDVAHRDLKAANLLIVDRDAGLDAYLIDLDGVRLLKRISPRRCARNIARLAASMEAHPWITRTDRLRFLRVYLREATIEATDWKSFWREVAAHSRKLLILMHKRQQVIH